MLKFIIFCFYNMLKTFEKEEKTEIKPLIKWSKPVENNCTTPIQLNYDQNYMHMHGRIK